MSKLHSSIISLGARTSKERLALGGAEASVIPDRREGCPAESAPLLPRLAATLRIVERLPTLRSADEPPARLPVKKHRPLTIAARPGAERSRLAPKQARGTEDIFSQVASLAALIAGADVALFGLLPQRLS